MTTAHWIILLNFFRKLLRNNCFCYYFVKDVVNVLSTFQMKKKRNTCQNNTDKIWFAIGKWCQTSKTTFVLY